MGLTAAQRAFLEERRFATLATIAPSGAPHLTVMWYLLDGDEIVFNSKVGRTKPRNIARDTRVALLVEDGYRFVRVHGRARTVADQPTAQRDIHRLAVRYNGEEAARQAVESRFSKEKRISYRLPVEHVYAAGFEEDV